MNEIAGRFAVLHQPEPWEQCPSCLYDGESWPCAAERWRRQREQQHEDADHYTANVVRRKRRRLLGLGLCLAFGLHLALTYETSPVGEPPIDEPVGESTGSPDVVRDESIRPDAPPTGGRLYEAQVFYLNDQPAFVIDEREPATLLEARAQMREARVAHVASRSSSRVDSRFLIGVLALGGRNTRFVVRCRCVDGSWRYEAIGGSVVRRGAAELLDAPDDAFSVHKRSEVG